MDLHVIGHDLVQVSEHVKLDGLRIALLKNPFEIHARILHISFHLKVVVKAD